MWEEDTSNTIFFAYLLKLIIVNIFLPVLGIVLILFLFIKNDMPIWFFILLPWIRYVFVLSMFFLFISALRTSLRKSKES